MIARTVPVSDAIASLRNRASPRVILLCLFALTVKSIPIAKTMLWDTELSRPRCQMLNGSFASQSGDYKSRWRFRVLI